MGPGEGLLLGRDDGACVGAMDGKSLGGMVFRFAVNEGAGDGLFVLYFGGRGRGCFGGLGYGSRRCD